MPTDPGARPDPASIDLWAPSTPAGATEPAPPPQPTGRAAAPARGGLFGGRQRSSAFGRPADEPAAAADGSFGAARNGYDRAQVDRRVAELTRQLAAAEEQRTETAHRLAAERRRGELVEQELREVRTAMRQAPPPAPAPEPGPDYGQRAERLLWLAEAEAREARSAAAGDAAALLQHAQAEADTRRREVERSLALRASALEAESARRAAAFETREQESAAVLEAARAEARQLRAAARRDVEAMHRDAEEAIRAARADAVRETEQAVVRRRDELAAEVERLEELRHTARQELARLHRRITDELAVERPAAVRPAASLPLAGRAEQGGPDPDRSVTEPVTVGRR
ncbi:hypothetical protein [Pseudonocardia humida]|uniref:DivIVA protein n=1 Tax=Pseudonocardia humida TaxID=2800819 RepID=A0ABT1ABK4_9PSEU|nr:hypothetical protein [Pseudonocardia humida]MCO1660019.1 hypothetical protein [Pseudonocardia humida]